MRKQIEPAEFFKMRGPCNQCPFLVNSPMKLRKGVLKSFWETLTEKDTSFRCHKTLDHKWQNKFCGGALVALVKSEKFRDNALIRLALSQGWLDLEQLNLDSETLSESEIENA